MLKMRWSGSVGEWSSVTVHRRQYSPGSDGGLVELEQVVQDLRPSVESIAVSEMTVVTAMRTQRDA